MTDPKTETAPAEKLLEAALNHVPFDGWTEPTYRAAVADSGIDPAVARGLYPRGAVDMALAYHRQGDAEMVRRLEQADLSAMRFRDRIATAVRLRLEAVEDREAVRRGTTLFSLPIYAADGAKAIWGTADLIWTTLGDSSDDVNWYTKRATLSGVYGSVVLFWLGDDSPGHQATWDFLDRRIDDVMQIEKIKAQLRDNKLLSGLLAGPNWLLGQIKAPDRAPDPDLPGHWAPPRRP
ncbi:ubiquinone biosynthesis protein COQ9 [Primorskyibacter sedentarius]|uniref:Ubiquinone biosynthesis protein COQ9 n=1 Tax=Primorskyibacter sedentarius TaxID=745311 RepID=A0A4R3J911_9RHOB|nr:COQ9 family protein [Primorskyibacter sedentarius]TCS61446.1 ubiquinone biosynthesis protein COQ9 [Primorskyibacter sedentarius]